MNSAIGALALMLLASLALLAYWIWHHPQEWAHVGPNRFKRWRAFWSARPMAVWIGVIGFCLVLNAFISNRTELVEVYEHIKCGDACPVLTAEDLRFRVVKSYLHHRLSVNIKRLEFASREKLVLLPVNLNSQKLAQGFEDSTLLTTLTTNSMLLETHSQIDELKPSVLTIHPSIAEYSLSYRTAIVIPIESIRPIRLQDVDPSLEPYAAAAQRIGLWERMRGYGNHFFQITEYWPLDLSCCDGRGDYGGTSLYKRKKSSLDSIRSNRPRILAVSNRGAILLWEGMGESSGLTYILLATEPYLLLPHQKLPFKEQS